MYKACLHQVMAISTYAKTIVRQMIDFLSIDENDSGQTAFLYSRDRSTRGGETCVHFLHSISFRRSRECEDENLLVERLGNAEAQSHVKTFSFH